MKYLWLNWKDLKHPEAGGAERVNHSIMTRLVKAGHEVTLLTSSFKGASETDEIDGIKIIRQGSNRYLHTFVAGHYYRKFLKNKFDIIIEVVNTAPYLVNLWKGNEKYFVFYHQLCRDVWFYETKFPLNVLGNYLLEPIANRLNTIGNVKVLTVSQSTANDLAGIGFKKEHIFILPENTESPRLASLEHSVAKNGKFTVLSFGALRKMKRPIEVLKAFDALQKRLPDCQLWIAGGGSKNDQKVLTDYIAEHNLSDKVSMLGRYPEEQKAKLMQQAHVFCMTSAYEGWGTTITEAANNGTPAVVYDRHGMRDAVVDKKTGYVVANLDYQAMADKFFEMATNKALYEELRRNAYQYAEQFNPDETFRVFQQIVG